MKCCVPECNNYHKIVAKSQGITYHVFPAETKLRAAWVTAIGKGSWEPRETSRVCSEHFLKEDLIETKNGHRRKVRPGAVPVVDKICRICLVVNREVYPFSKYNLDDAYEYLTGVLPCADSRLPQKLCAECMQRLVQCDRLRRRSVQANALLLEVLERQECITVKSVEAIDRDKYDLNTPLSSKILSPNHCDLIIYEETESNKGKETILEINTESEVKNEENNEIFFNEFDKEKLEIDNDDFTDDKEIPLIDNEAEIKSENGDAILDYMFDDQMDEQNNDDNIDDDEYRAEESSTDDELPRGELRRRLQERRSKKEKKVEKKRKIKKEIVKSPAEPKIDKRRKPFFNDDRREALFTITDLTFEEQLAEIDKRKEGANYKNGVYKCDECYKGFLDEEAYTSHMSRHTNECGEARCPICKTHFKHPHALRKHVTAHHTQRFSCRQCPYSTTHRQSARLHERWHKGTKYACPQCPDEFVKFTTYMGHLRIKHPSDFVCQLCGYSFVSEKGIQLHKRLKHRNEMQIAEDAPRCEPCNLRFIDSEALTRHLSVSARHNTPGRRARAPNKPTKGQKSREKRKDMDMELPKYAGQMKRAEGPIPCEQCGLQLENSRAYHGHFRRMHPDKNRTKYPAMKTPCMCEMCGRMFQSYALLKDHCWVHTGERPFSCDVCGKSFRMKQRLVAHRRVHSAHKQTYSCALCGKHFSTHSNRQRHMFIHTGLKPFKCEMCGKSFKHASEKRAHVTYVHLKKPWPKRSRGKRRAEARQAPMQPATVPTDGDIGLQQLWPACDPKLQHGHDKAPYFALKM